MASQPTLNRIKPSLMASPPHARVALRWSARRRSWWLPNERQRLEKCFRPGTGAKIEAHDIPKPRICRLAIACPGWLGSPGK